jgi:hypothetical protein
MKRKYGVFGNCAIMSAKKIAAESIAADEAWGLIISSLTDSSEMRTKSCPKQAFLT